MALSTRAIDATVLSYPDINEAIRAGMHALADMSEMKEASFPMNVMAARRSFVDKNRDTVKRLQQAYAEGTYLFNYVAGRWELEAFGEKPTTLVFIGEHVTRHQADLVEALKCCEQSEAATHAL